MNREVYSHKSVDNNHIKDIFQIDRIEVEHHHRFLGLIVVEMGNVFEC